MMQTNNCSQVCLLETVSLPPFRLFDGEVVGTANHSFLRTVDMSSCDIRGRSQARRKRPAALPSRHQGGSGMGLVARSGGVSCVVSTSNDLPNLQISNGKFGRALSKLSAGNSGQSPSSFGRSKQRLIWPQSQTRTNEQRRGGSQASSHRLTAS